MPLSKQKQKDLQLLKKKACDLHNEGFSLRAVGEQVGRSYEWVRQVIKEEDKKEILDPFEKIFEDIM